jgi:hypothetical protein
VPTDGSVTEVDDASVITDHAYLLFYMRKSVAQQRYNLDALKTAAEPTPAPAAHPMERPGEAAGISSR